MTKSVQLPFYTPMFSTTQGSAAVGLTVTEDSKMYNQILNHCLTLSCTKKFINGFTTPEVSVPKMSIHTFPGLERYTVNLRYTHRCCEEIIKKMLNDGYYIYFNGIDDYYMPGKSWYGIRHMNHDGIICGYDESDMTYSIAAYDINWIFRLIRIPQKCFIEAMYGAMETNYYGNLIAYRARDISVVLDKKFIVRSIKEHLSSVIEKYSMEASGTVTGIAVYDFLSMYIEKLKDGSIPSDKMDWRALRPVWEHNQCMVKRLRAMEDSENLDYVFSSEYEKIADLANRVRMMYAMYHKTKKENLLDSIKKGLWEIKEGSQNILSAFVKKMEE